ncbi:hypothetical protein [Mycobacteroides salmoniphilum]|uniref:Uncharacterized protein n=1 Tax=Mycobacteroides salmoniphilum TaxID=404941 RepID=A0A4V3HZ78_9MYCO|nr:hypothetical protein [Mycobacteroides salmoniphilum]TDZ92097.1 hypothetical protein CCUG60885_04211 [Mycobacteroides salmoniphilum]TEA07327.1 hypothetical protein CCUG60883_01360 [Mycobacteroides salmoniphilum]
MSAKLNPSEAQREAMAQVLGSFVANDLTWCGDVLGDMIAAANSIPEGAPVGTIARRPDGGNIAERMNGGDTVPNWWRYMTTNFTDKDDADSWPVIYLPPITITDGPWGLLTFHADLTAQQEPAPWVCGHPNHGNNDHDCNPFRPPGSPRIPRVRDRLGVDEQGARWAAESGGVYRHDGSQWVTTYRHGGVTRWGKGFEPHVYEYTEILEPRVLPSLDCAEARDGTVWTKDNPVSPGRRFQFVSGIWMTRNDDDDWYRLNCDGLLCGSGYTEVIGDPVQ